MQTCEILLLLCAYKILPKVMYGCTEPAITTGKREHDKDPKILCHVNIAILRSDQYQQHLRKENNK